METGFDRKHWGLFRSSPGEQFRDYSVGEWNILNSNRYMLIDICYTAQMRERERDRERKRELERERETDRQTDRQSTQLL